MADRRPHSDDLPSDAVLDELLRAFEVDDLSKGGDVDLESPEVEALLSGEQDRPDDEPRRPAGDRDGHERDAADESADTGPDPDESIADDPAARSPHPDPGHGEDDDGGDGIVRIIAAGDDDHPSTPDDEIGALEDESDPADHRVGERQVDHVDQTDREDHELDDAEGVVATTPADGGPARVVIDADDGGDDPIYVDGSLAPERDDGLTSADDENTVFIDDGAMERADAVGSPEAARVSGIEPKLRERRVAVQRAEGRKRLRWVVVGIGAVVVLVAALIVLGSSLFTIGDVEVEGAAQSEGETLDEIVEELSDENIWGADLESYRERIERIPSVDGVRISKGLLGGATVEVAEREPTAVFAGADGRFRVIDAEGRVLRVADERPAVHPLIGTVEDEDAPNTEPGSFADPGFGNAGAYASMLTPGIAERLDVISVARDGSDTRLLLQGGTEVLLGDGTDPVGKLARLENEIVRYDGELPAHLDVSTDEVTNVPG